jgi:hypothetical protein
MDMTYECKQADKKTKQSYDSEKYFLLHQIH